jgi:hypothetical protein
MFDLRLRCQVQDPIVERYSSGDPDSAPAARVFTEEQYQVVAWAITVINAFNRIGVTQPQAPARQALNRTRHATEPQYAQNRHID